MERIILYSTGCPLCKVLKSKLNDKKMQFTEINDVEAIKGLGIKDVPVLSVNGILYNFNEAVKLINSRKDENI